MRLLVAAVVAAAAGFTWTHRGIVAVFSSNISLRAVQQSGRPADSRHIR